MEVVYLQGIANFVKKKIKKKRKKAGKNLEVKKKGVPLQSRSGNEQKRQ